MASALGFGAMRLPTIGGEGANVNEAEAIAMIRYAVDHGLNYIDTAYGYHKGNSEIVVGKALRDDYRRRVKIATKLPTWLVNSHADMDNCLNEQLKRLQTDHIDFYLLHGLQKERWTKMLELSVFDWAEKAISEGRIVNLGFSFHDGYEVFKSIVDGYEHWTFCQIQYNYENEDLQAGTQGLKYAASKGLAVVIMEPLLGGYLTRPPDGVNGIWESANKDPVDMALQWLWNKPEVSVVLSGMSTMEQIQQNVECASSSGVETLTKNDLDLISRVHHKYDELRPIPCTKCGYCMPCPNGVDIPSNFDTYNLGIAYNKLEMSKEQYNGKFFPPEKRASACKACKTCEEKCPQHIPISEWMPKVHQELSYK